MSNDIVNLFPFQAEAEGNPEVPPYQLLARDDYQTPQARLTELTLGPTGPFRQYIEDYMTTAVPGKYMQKAHAGVRCNVAKFFRFAVQDQQLDTLDQIRPSTITRYIEVQREFGHTSFVFLGHLASFLSGQFPLNSMTAATQ